MGRDGHRDHIVTVSVEIGVTQCDVSMSLHSNTYPDSTVQVHWYTNGTCALMHTGIEAFSCDFSTISICLY